MRSGTLTEGEQSFLAGANGRERARAVHLRLIEDIHDFESLAESNAEMLAVEGVTASQHIETGWSRDGVQHVELVAARGKSFTTFRLPGVTPSCRLRR